MKGYRRRRIQVLVQVVEQRGVGKSALTLHLADALCARGLQLTILDADFNGPSQARMAGFFAPIDIR